MKPTPNTETNPNNKSYPNILVPTVDCILNEYHYWVYIHHFTTTVAIAVNE